MGTNYYLKHIPTTEEHEKMQNALFKKQYDSLLEIIHETCRTYHIGKQSGGWQFLFAPNKSIRVGCYDDYPNPWNNSLESLQKVLSDSNYQIRNEYGEILTPEEFWESIRLYNDPETAINISQYYQKHPRPVSNGYDYFSPENTEFTTEEGLRFSTDIDFA